MDLRAAFDSVDRERLIKVMRERGVREGLVPMCEDMLRKTRSKVKVGREMGSQFWTGRGVRQGCPLSPGMFNLLMSDLEEEMRREGWRGVRLETERVYTLAYTDDVVLLAEEKERIRCMIERLGRYLERKGLKLNAEKSKVMRFRRRGGRKK